MSDGGYDISDARRAGCGCGAIGGIAILVGWFVLFVLSLGDCLQADNVACHARAIHETQIVGIATLAFLIVAAAVIFHRYFSPR